MTKYEIIGVSNPIQRTSKNTGAIYNGFNVSFAYESPNYQGFRTKEHFIMERNLDGYVPHVGDHVYIIYGQSFNGQAAPVDGLLLVNGK